jgi:hypothetical protein
MPSLRRSIGHGGVGFSDGESMIPFSYCIPDEFIVDSVPEKTQIQSFVVPNMKYSFGPGEQQLYYNEYRRSRFAVTRKKGGWDCMRHYEILANGCIPIFENLEECPYFTMTTFPKDLVLKANRELLPWDDSYIPKYNEIVQQLLDHCRKYCSVSARTDFFLSQFPGAKKILMISGNHHVNYLRETLAIGLRRKLGANFVDYPKLDVLYNTADLSNKIGFGYSYGGLLPDIPIDRSNTVRRLLQHEFDVIIYGKVGYAENGPRGNMDKIEVAPNYRPREVAFLYGGDGLQDTKDTKNPWTQHLAMHCNRGLCFVRELN